MSMTRVIDLDDRRTDYELNCIVYGVLGITGAGIILYLYADQFGITGKFPRPDLKLSLLTIGLLAASVLGPAAFVRSLSRGRTLVLDLEARSYEVRTGLFKQVVLWSGPFADFAQLRLDMKIRRVYGRKNMKRRRFWTITLVWKDPDRRPICLQEHGGERVPPPPEFFRLDYRGAFDQARADLDRWGHDLGIPVIDTVKAPGEDLS